MAPIRGKWSFWRGFRNPEPRLPEVRPPCTHVVLLDGTMSSLRRGSETNIGLTYRLLSELGEASRGMLYYEPGIQWRGMRRAIEVLAGIGINRQIKRAYLFLARNYRPGDRIYLMGYSRGAFAVRSLAGLIDKLGLLRPAQVSEETLERLYRLYQEAPDSQQARAFRSARCHERVQIELVGVYDTVRALGLLCPRTGLAQVSMNVEDYRRTPLLAVVERVRREAAARGLVAGDSELVGLVPRAALAGASPGELGLPRLLPGQVIEMTED